MDILASQGPVSWFRVSLARQALFIADTLVLEVTEYNWPNMQLSGMNLKIECKDFLDCYLHVLSLGTQSTPATALSNSSIL